MDNPFMGGLGRPRLNPRDHDKTAEPDDETDSDEAEGENKNDASPDEPVGPGSGTVVMDQSPDKKKTVVRCDATSCVFNQEGLCSREAIEIRFTGGQGMQPSATKCMSYQSSAGQ